MFRSPIFNYSGKPIYPIRLWGGVERAARQASASLSQQQSSGDTVELSGQNGNSSRKSKWQGFRNFCSNLFNGFSSCRSSSEVRGPEENIGIVNEIEGTNTDATAVQNFTESVKTSKEGQNTPAEKSPVKAEPTSVSKSETSVVQAEMENFNNTVNTLYEKLINNQGITTLDIEDLLNSYRNDMLCSDDILRHFAYVLCEASRADLFNTNDNKPKKLKECIADIMACCQDEKDDIKVASVYYVLCAATSAGVFKTDEELNTLRGYIAKFMAGCQDEKGDIKKDWLKCVNYVLHEAIEKNVFQTKDELNKLKGYMEKVKSVIRDESVQIDEKLKKQILDDNTIIINKILSFYVKLKASKPLSVEQPLEEPEVQSVVQEKLAEKPKEGQNTVIIDKTKSTSQEEHIEKPTSCFKTNKEMEIFVGNELNNDSINNDNINPEPLKEIIKETSNEQVEANGTERDEENHNSELQVNLNQIEKNNNSNDDAQLKEIEQRLKTSKPSSIEQPLEEPVAQPAVHEVPSEEPPVEAKSTSVSEPEAQEITYDGLCKMIESSSLANETQGNLKDSLNSESINVEDIKEIILAVKAETLQKEHNLVCSLLKFLMKKGIDSEQLTAFKNLIKHLIKNSVLTSDDHSIVSGALNILGNNSKTQSWILAAIAIKNNLLTDEEQDAYCTITVESIMRSNNFQSCITNMLFINLEKNILSSIINHEKLSDQQLLCIVKQVYKFILEAIDDDDAINDISNFIAKDGILTKLLNKIKIIKNTKTQEQIINNFANILYNIMLWMATKQDEDSDDIGSLKESLKDLFSTFKPTLESYNSRAWGITMPDGTQDPLWTNVLAKAAQNIGIDMS